MQLGMIGLGRMGANLVRRLAKNDHECVVYDVSAAAVKAIEGYGSLDEAGPAPLLSAALYERFTSRDGADFANRVLSAMRKQFGGHDEKSTGKKPG